MIQNRGFTMIELSIAVAIVALLAAIAIPSYMTYTLRAKLSEVLTISADCRYTIITKSANAEATAANQWGCEQNIANSATDTVSNYVKSITVEANGTIHITVYGLNNSAVDDKEILFIPYDKDGNVLDLTIGGQGIVDFACRTQSGSGVPQQYLPRDCETL